MQGKAFILLMLLTMSAASRAATDDFDSFTGVGWVWILALSLYAVIAVILLVASCRAAAPSDAIDCEAILKKARAPRPLSNVDSRIASRWAPRINHLDLNFADFAPLDIHIVGSDEVVARVDDVVAPEVEEQA